MTAEKKRRILYLGAALTVALAALVCWASFRPEALKPVYDITVNVAHTGGDAAAFQFSSTADTLYEAQLDAGLFRCVELADGSLFLADVDGETAHSSWSQYWGWNRNGDRCYGSVDRQAIADGDVFDFYIYTYTG